MLCKLKTPKDPQYTPGVVYQIHCGAPGCSKSYIGETSKWLAKRVSEHQDNVKKPSHNEKNGRPSALVNHVRTTGHAIKWSSAHPVARAPNGTAESA